MTELQAELARMSVNVRKAAAFDAPYIPFDVHETTLHNNEWVSAEDRPQMVEHFNQQYDPEYAKGGSKSKSKGASNSAPPVKEGPACPLCTRGHRLQQPGSREAIYHSDCPALYALLHDHDIVPGPKGRLVWNTGPMRDSQVKAPTKAATEPSPRRSGFQGTHSGYREREPDSSSKHGKSEKRPRSRSRDRGPGSQ